MSTQVSVSIVTYSPDFDLLHKTIASLRKAVYYAVKWKDNVHTSLYLVDNGPGSMWRSRLERLCENEWFGYGCDKWKVISPSSNVGFGQGHNMALEHSRGKFHLFLNPDVIMAEDSLLHAVNFMERNEDIGLLSPRAFNELGSRQYLCKQFPSVFDFMLRGFAPNIVRQIFKRRLAQYEMCGITEDHVVKEILIASGCFMFFRKDILDRIGGFSPQFFLYFEDFDLSLRTAAISTIAYVPEIKIIHFGGHTAKKSIWHILQFVKSAFLFYRIHGIRLI